MRRCSRWTTPCTGPARSCVSWKTAIRSTIACCAPRASRSQNVAPKTHRRRLGPQPPQTIRNPARPIIPTEFESSFADRNTCDLEENALAADPYQTLGVKRDAAQTDVQKAYRRLAKKLHPDLNPGNKKAEEEFKNVSAAYNLLADPDKRARFDRGEIDASAADRPQPPSYPDFPQEGPANPH